MKPRIRGTPGRVNVGVQEGVVTQQAHARPPAVAGTFYQGDPLGRIPLDQDAVGQLRQGIDGVILESERRRGNSCRRCGSTCPTRRWVA